MNKIIYCLFIVFLFLSCNNGEPDKKSSKENVSEKEISPEMKSINENGFSNDYFNVNIAPSDEWKLSEIPDINVDKMRIAYYNKNNETYDLQIRLFPNEISFDLWDTICHQAILEVEPNLKEYLLQGTMPLHEMRFIVKCYRKEKMDNYGNDASIFFFAGDTNKIYSIQMGFKFEDENIDEKIKELLIFDKKVKINAL